MSDHLRLKVKIYPATQPTRREVTEICRRLRDFCDESFSHRSTVDVMEGYGMGHGDRVPMDERERTGGEKCSPITHSWRWLFGCPCDETEDE